MKIRDLHSSNIYDITLTKTSGEELMMCPVCSHSRKKKNDKCMAWNIDKGVGFCHHCTTSFIPQISMRERPAKEYKIPEWKNLTELSNKAVKWFEGRSISQDTIRKMRIYSDNRFMRIRMPNGAIRETANADVIAFPFFMPGEDSPRNIKYRGAFKSFSLESGAELIFYNYSAIPKNTEIIITEGECYSGETEILTDKGFVRFDDYDGEKVAYVDDSGIAKFDYPQAFITKLYDEDMIKITANKSYSSLVTKNHLVPVVEDGKIIKIPAIELYKRKIDAIRTPSIFAIQNKEMDISDTKLRMLIAMYYNVFVPSPGRYHGLFKSIPRALEFAELCMLNGIRAHKTSNSGFRTKSKVLLANQDVPKEVFFKFPKEWISQLNDRQCRIIIDAISHWHPDVDFEYTCMEVPTVCYDDADFICTIASMAGFSARMEEYDTDMYTYKVFIDKVEHLRLHGIRSTKEDFFGTVYCVQVPTGMIVTRHDGIVCVTSNCDALSYIEAGLENVISVPNGAGAKDLSYLDHYIDDLEHVTKFYIATDFDEAGLKLREELIRRLGAERCSIVTFQGFKDANELLINKGVIALKDSISNAQEIPLQGTVEVESLYDELQAMFTTGLPKGVELGFQPMDKLIRWETGRLNIVSGIPSSGKSNFVDFLNIRLNIMHGWKTAYWSPENHPTKLHIANLAEKVVGKKFKAGSMNQMEFDAVFDYIRENFFFINPDEHTRLSEILEMAKQLVKRRGIKHLVIDPLNCLTPESNEENRSLQIEELLNILTTFARKYDLLVTLVAHPRKIPDEGGRMKIPTMYDISGSSTFYDKADYGIIVYRWFDRKQTQVFVQKVKWRNLGRINEDENDGLMMFNPANGRYDEVLDYRLMDNHNYLDDIGQEEFVFDDLPPDTMPMGVEFDDLP